MLSGVEWSLRDRVYVVEWSVGSGVYVWSVGSGVYVWSVGSGVGCSGIYNFVIIIKFKLI